MANPFPEIQPDICRRKRTSFQNRVQGADGSIQINVPHPLLPRGYHCEWSITPDTDVDTILDHWELCSAIAFTFFDFNRRAMRTMTIGTGNGSTKTFTLPAKEVSTAGLVIKVNTTTYVLGVDFTLSSGTGLDGADQITFTSAPAAASTITFAAARARRRVTVFYESTSFEEDPYEGDLVRIAIDFIEQVA